MQIKLISLSLRNFKGIRALDIDFGSETDIYGRNATGKTTVVDAFLWLLFGKDSTDRKDFEIKTLDKNGQPYHQLTHEVKAVLDADGETITLRRVYTEKWTKKRGSATEEFTGHTNEFFWNDVPYAEKEYQAKLSNYIQEGQFKLLTNLGYFNEVMKWQDRRSLLLQLAGGQSELEIAQELNTEGQFDDLIGALKQKKTLQEYAKEITAKKGVIKRESESLPDRIDEARRTLPTPVNLDEVQKEIARKEEDLIRVEELLSNKSAEEKEYQTQLSSLTMQKGNLERRLMALENEALIEVQKDRLTREAKISEQRTTVNTKMDERNRLRIEHSRLQGLIEGTEKRLASLDEQMAQLRKDFEMEKAKEFEFDPTTCVCPACKQPLPEVDAKEQEDNLRKNFNAEKARKLGEINTRGVQYKESREQITIELESLRTEIANVKTRGEGIVAEIQVLQKQLSDLETENNSLSLDERAAAQRKFDSNPEVVSIRAEIDALVQQIAGPKPTVDKTELHERKSAINHEIDALKKTLAAHEVAERTKLRIEELMNQEKESANELARLEGIEFSLLEYDKAKMALVENRINTKFSMVKFKLFDQQVNGGVAPTCVTLINGVPYPDANTASKINASLDIIHVFSNHYGVKAPVFIDNRESVLSLIPTDLQIINLVVSKEDYELRVESRDKQPAQLFV